MATDIKVVIESPYLPPFVLNSGHIFWTGNVLVAYCFWDHCCDKNCKRAMQAYRYVWLKCSFRAALRIGPKKGLWPGERKGSQKRSSGANKPQIYTKSYFSFEVIFGFDQLQFWIFSDITFWTFHTFGYFWCFLLFTPSDFHIFRFSHFDFITQLTYKKSSAANQISFCR